jgi:hypothetical protein
VTLLRQVGWNSPTGKPLRKPAKKLNGLRETNDTDTVLQEMSWNWKSERSIVR